jgi:hypothetical protein
VEYAQDEDIGIRYLVSDFIIAHDDSAHFPRLEFGKA